MNKYYKIESYDELGRFLSYCNEQNYKWASGHSLFDEEIFAPMAALHYPIIIEVDSDTKKVYRRAEGAKYPKNMENFSSIITDIKKENKPIVFPIIRIVSPDGETHTYSYDSYFKDPQKFHEYMIKLDSFEVGDVVEVIDGQQIISAYCEWFEENEISVSIAARYPYASYDPCGLEVKDKKLFKIVAVGPHRSLDEMVYAVEEQDSYSRGQVHLILKKGIRKVY